MKILKYAWGVPVAAAVFWLGTLGQSQVRQPTVPWEEWAERVNGWFKQQAAQMSLLNQRMDALWTLYDRLVVAHNSVVDGTEEGFAGWQRWAEGVQIALRRAQQPIIVQPPVVTVDMSRIKAPVVKIDTWRIEQELRDIQYELWKQNTRSF